MAAVGSKESTVSQLLVGFYSAERSRGSQLSATNFRQKIMRLQHRRRIHCLAFPHPPIHPHLKPVPGLPITFCVLPGCLFNALTWLKLNLSPPSCAQTPGRGHAGSLHRDWQGWQWTQSLRSHQVCWLALCLPQHWGLTGKVSRQAGALRKNF